LTTALSELTAATEGAIELEELDGLEELGDDEIIVDDGETEDWTDVDCIVDDSDCDIDCDGGDDDGGGKVGGLDEMKVEYELMTDDDVGMMTGDDVTTLGKQLTAISSSNDDE
jgi:hypothetical protein